MLQGEYIVNKKTLKTRKMSIRIKVIGLGALAIIFSIVSIAFISYIIASNSLEKMAFNQLTAVRAIKATQIESFFHERLGDVNVYAFNTAVQQAAGRFTEAFYNGGVKGEQWQQWERVHGTKFHHYVKQYGYYDLFIISPKGDIVYTASKEKDLGQNLVRGSLSDSNLADAFKAAKNGKITFADFKWYDPSNEPASFVAAPMKNLNGQLVGILALQVSLKDINKIMQQRDGMGKTGETYLVGKDLLMRSDSFLDQKNHTVKASFKNPEKGKVETEATEMVFNGKTETKIITDYNGNPVVSSFQPVSIGDVTYAAIAEIDVAEVMDPVYTLRNIVLAVAAVILVVSIFIFFLVINRSIVRPILLLKDTSMLIADGDLTSKVEYSSNDELGELSDSFNSFIANMHQMITQIVLAAQNLSQAVEQIASGNQNLSSRTTEQAASLEEIASTIEEATATINQNAENAQTANKDSIEASALAEKGGEVVVETVDAMTEINGSSKKIGEIISVINEIAFQTNLLALNAAVEAARAGEQGRGFAVVAGEVRNLAQRASGAAKEIEDLITDSLEKVNKGAELSGQSGESLNKIIEAIKTVSQIVSEITAASEEQKSGMNQINNAITEMDSATQQNSSLVEETAAASEEMANQAQELLGMVGKFKINDESTSGIFNKKVKVHQLQDGDGGNGKNSEAKNEEKQTNVTSKQEGGDISSIMKEDGFSEF